MFITLIPIGILFFKRRRLDISFRFLLVYLVGKLLTDSLMIYYASTGQNNIWLHNLVVPFRYFMLSSVFYHLLESPRFKKWIRISVPLFLILALGDVYFSNSQSSSLSEHLYIRYGGIVECLLMLLWILLYFYEVFSSLKIANLLRSPGFLVATAWLFYYASLVFFVPLFYYVYRIGSRLDLGYLQFIPDLMEILVIIILTVGVSFISVSEHD